jgi:hypothetical protein
MRILDPSKHLLQNTCSKKSGINDDDDDENVLDF